MATAATWRTGDKLFIEPTVLVGASTSGGRQYVDPDLTGGAAYIQNGRLYVHYPVSNETRPAAVVTTTYSQAQKRSYSKVIAFAVTSSLTFSTMIAKQFLFAISSTFSSRRIVQLMRSMGVSAALTMAAQFTLVMKFLVATSYSFSRLISLTRTFTSQLVTRIDGVIQRTGADIGVAVSALLFGRRGPVHVRYRFYKSDISGTTGEEIKGVTNASVSMSNFRDHTWELTFDMLESAQIDPLKSYIKVVAQVRHFGVWRSFPLGLYLLRKPKTVKSQAFTRWSLTGRSPEVLLGMDMPNVPYNALPGQDVLALVRQIILDRGVPADRIVFPPGGATLTSGITFDPVVDQAGTYWLRIANTLLNAGGYYALYTDEEGKFTTKKMGSRTVIEADVRMGPEYEPVVVNEVQDSYEDDRFANRVIVFSRNVNDTPPIVATAENHNAASPASFEQLGRWETKTVNLTTVVTQADAQTMAQAELERASGFYRKITLQTIPDPRRKPREVYEVLLRDRSGRTVVDGLWDVTSWTLPLTAAPTTMSHEISRIEKV